MEVKLDIATVEDHSSSLQEAIEIQLKLEEEERIKLEEEAKKAEEAAAKLKQEQEEAVAKAEAIRIKEEAEKAAAEKAATQTTTTSVAKSFTAEITAYCPCVQCCGKTNGITASGTKATANRTIAMSSAYSFGTQVKIGNTIYTVEDRGGAIQNNRVDIYFNTHQEALNFGRQSKTIEILN